MKFSIVIALAPDRNAEVLNSLNKIDYPKNKFEIIIKKGLNPSDNRNNGVKEAKGEIIAFIDDDAIVDKNLLKNAEEFFYEHKEIDLVGGPQLTPDDDKYFAKTSGFVLSSYFGSHNMSNRYKRGKENLDADETYITSANCFIKKKSFNKTKGFDPRLFPGEDPEFFTRIKNEGLKIAYSPELIIYHRRRADFKGFIKQVFKYGNVRCLKAKINKEKLGLVFFMPMLFSLFFIPVVALSLIISYWFLLPVGIYFFIDLLVSLFIGLKHGLHRVPLLVLLFFLWHFGYGIGMLGYFIKKAEI